MSQPPTLTAEEQKLNDVWNEHLRAEFSAHSAEEGIATMVAHPRVHQVPVMIGGDGQDEVYEFYAHYSCPRSHRISRRSRCRGPSARGGWSMR
jgi:hypothetical protein